MAKLVTSSRNITANVRKEVIDVMREVLSDSDASLELTANFVRCLKKSVKEKKQAKRPPYQKF